MREGRQGASGGGRCWCTYAGFLYVVVDTVFDRTSFNDREVKTVFKHRNYAREVFCPRLRFTITAL